ncbi:MAG: hypothetical protein H0W88_05185 [Parachlamydiaceae bacterium]|nr:hypothetical protein [Parachlamydiaceae bacterium]
MTNNSSEDQKESIDSKIHHPEVILIDSTNEHIYGPNPSFDEAKQEEDELWHMQKKHYPMWIRFFCLFSLFISLIFLAIVSLYVVVILFFVVLTFFQNEEIIEKIKSGWLLFKNCLVVTLALTIGLFSPTLGIGLIIVYFSMKGDEKDKLFLKRILKKFL